MSGAFATARAGGARTDLVAEVQRRSHAVRQQVVADNRRARRRTVMVSVAMVVVALGLAGAGKLAFDEYRVHRVLETAHAQVAEGTPEALALAVTSIERGLSIEPGHAAGLSTLALVRAQQAVDGTVTVEEAEQAIAAAGESPEAIVSAAIVAVLRGDIEGAAPALALDSTEEGAGHGPNAAAVQQAQAWIRAQVALHDLEEPSSIASAIAAIEASREQTAGWDRNLRTAAALYFRAGQVDRALEQLDAGLTLRPADAGLRVDQALLHAALQQDIDDIEATVDPLLESAALPEHDAARARLARAIAHQYDDGDAAAQAELASAYEGLGHGDHFARGLALEAALSSGAPSVAQRWIDQGHLPATAAELHGAWVDFAEDRVAQSLQRLAELPQGHPRVALVQGLALVEQGRFEEARTWLGRAQESFVRRPLLEVAAARVDAHLDPPGPAIDRLEIISKAHPRTARVWTGLAEALALASEDGQLPARAEAPLRRALEREAVPAQAAHLLGRWLETRSAEDPALVAEALAMHRKAVALREWEPRYQESLGRLLADAGSRDEAQSVLEGVADASSVDPTSLLVLAELTAEQAAAQQVIPPAKIATWLATAAQRGAPPAALVHTNARIALLAGTPEGLGQARAWVEPLLRSDPRDLDARLIHIEILRQEKDIDGARASLRTGMRKTRRKREGRLYFAWSQVESDAGKKRRAASLAYQAWRRSVAEPRPANELLTIAQIGTDRWLALGNASGARSIGRGLTRQVPYRAEAWTLRAKAQLEARYPEESCQSAAKAIELDGTLAAAHVALADCELELRHRAAARAALEKAVELTSSEPDASLLRRRLRRLGK